MAPLPIVSTALLAPGGLQYRDFVRGASAVMRLPDNCPVGVGAPLTESLDTAEDCCWPILPRPLLLALTVGHRLEIENGPEYGLVLAMSSLLDDPAYVEHALKHRNEPEEAADIEAFRGHSPLAFIADALAVTGPRVRIDSACASGSDALILAHQWIEAGYVEDVLVIAASSMLNPVGLALFNNLRALSPDSDLSASRPFDRKRSGFVMGEGAAAVWLSKRTPKKPQGYLCSYGQSMNAFKLTDMPTDTTAMERACRDALDGRSEVAFVSTHGTSTPANDACENRLYKRLLGDRAYDTPMSSLKSMTGHCLGASSLMEAIVALDVLRSEEATPTINLIDRDPECDLNYVPQRSQPIVGGFALSNAFAFGGHNSSLLLALEAAG